MKKILFLLLLLTVTGCVACETTDGAHKEPIDFPVLRPINNEVVYPFSEPEITPLENDREIVIQEVCDWEDGSFSFEPRSVDEFPIKGIYKEIDFEYVYDFDLSDETQRQLIISKYIHVDNIVLTMVAGDNFHYVNWIKVFLVKDGNVGPLLAWGGNFEDSVVIFLQTDSSINVKEYLTEKNQITFKVEIRAKSPQYITWIRSHITFVNFYKCHDELVEKED